MNVLVIGIFFVLIVLQEIRIRDLQHKVDRLEKGQKGLLELSEKELKAIKEMIKFVREDHESVSEFLDSITSVFKDSEE